jgi:hypothetical protein
MAMQSLDSALQMAESALHAVLAPYGNFGLELNTRPNDLWSVMGEVEPNKFKKVVKVRSHTFEGLQMLLEGEGEWRSLDVTDYKFLLEEVQSAIRAIWE